MSTDNAYQNGQLILPASASGQTTQSIKNPGLKTDVSSTPDCTDWYLDTYVNGVLASSEYIGTTCVITGTGNGGGGSSPAPPPTCTAGGGTGVQSTGGLTVNVAGPPPGGGTNPTPPGQTPPSNPNPGTGFLPPGTPCPTDNIGADFGEDDPSECLNCRVSDDNFDDLLDYAANHGLTVSAPFDYPVTGADGTVYPGQATVILNGNQIVAVYFSPDATSGPFEVGTEYSITPEGPGTNTSTGSTGSSGLNFGNPSTYLGSNATTIIYIPGGGGTQSFIPMIKLDSLKKHFPCAAKLIVDALLSIHDYNNLVAPFTTTIKPDLIWTNSTLPWNAPIPNSTSTTYILGQTSYVGRSATITLNTNMLQNSSTLFIAAAAIHETLHAYINYNIETAVGGFLPPSNYNSAGSWLYTLDTWATINGVPANYRDHYQMLSDYFSKAIGILAAWDNNAHTTKQYAEAMLYGLNNGTDGSAAQQALLQTEFNSLLTQYGVSTTDLNTFNIANLNAPTANKLPTSGCN